MKLAVFNPVLYSMNLDDALKYLKGLGVDALELGCGGFPGTAHANVRELDKDQKKLDALKSAFAKHGVQICALSVHGNGVHPDKKTAELATAEFDAACSVARKLGVRHIVTFSGCPGDGKGTAPNWVTCTWPNEYSELLAWQWNEVLIPYWKTRAAVAKDASVKVCFEMHPGFCVYNPQTMLKLRAAVGDTLGANLDPSHLLWQGIDIVRAVEYLGDALYYFHAKDTMLNPSRLAEKGVLDTAPYTNESERSWLFRTVGYGGVPWRNVVTALRMAGYDYVMSIEHEDSLMTPKEGLEKAVAYLKEVMIFDSSKTAAWWT
ncbi:MAG: sugar phosphate isomerase/epimerase [Clostridiales bacterium]|jgi:sugar phosphate isomerase/epimerase|nr:sugar phosphate isomerase/epimerase [Clostridiales bacterium]